MGKKNRNSFSLESLEKRNIFSVPEGYFLNLAQNIENRIPELNPFLKRSIYKVPDGYFEKLQIAVSQRINHKSFLENPESKKSVFHVEEGYFSSLENKILQKVLPIKTRDAKEIFTVPEGYFDSLKDKIYHKTHSKGKVIRHDFNESTVWKYAVAASVSLLIVGSGLFYFLSGPSNHQMADQIVPEVKAEALIASLNKVDIQQYLEKLENIENQDLVEFSSKKKIARINKDFDMELIPKSIGEKDKQNLELELEDLDLSELPTDI